MSSEDLDKGKVGAIFEDLPEFSLRDWMEPYRPILESIYEGLGIPTDILGAPQPSPNNISLNQSSRSVGASPREVPSVAVGTELPQSAKSSRRGSDVW